MKEELQIGKIYRDDHDDIYLVLGRISSREETFLESHSFVKGYRVDYTESSYHKLNPVEIPNKLMGILYGISLT